MAIHLRGVLLPEDVERDLYVAGGLITFTRPADEEFATIGREGFVVPGLVDLHAHLELASPAGEEAPAMERSLASARAQLAAGVLALREPGGIERASTGIGPHQGLPRTFTAGRFLSTRDAYLPGWAREVTDDELPEAALDEVRHSGSWVKVIGDWPVEGRHEPLEEGVRVLAGTDAGVGPHGMVRREIAALRGVGMSPTDALAAGSWDARRFLGLPGLDEGAPADIAVFADDPRRDGEPLDAPILIILDGTVISAGAPV